MSPLISSYIREPSSSPLTWQSGPASHYEAQHHDLLPESNTFLAPPMSLFHPLVLLERVSELSQAQAVNSSAILAAQERHAIQVLATTTSCVSITATIIAVYWFCMMRRNFRRDLILLLFVGDFFKSLWFLIFSAYTFVNGQVSTESGFCQASGYFLQVGMIMCDLAIMLMSLHMYLQIFPPKNSHIGPDGLYRIRAWMYGGWALIPIVDASLAFVNSGPAYLASGPFCVLPIRPFWYRLALSWIPRYLIWLFIMAVAIRIYQHAGLEFKVFGEVSDDSSSFPQPNSSLDNSAVTHDTRNTDHDDVEADDRAGLKHEEDIAPDRIPSLVTKPDTRQVQSGLTQTIPDESASPKHATPSDQMNERHWKPNWNISFGSPITRLNPKAHGLNSHPASRWGSQPRTGDVVVEDFAPQSTDTPAGGRRESALTMRSMRSETSHTHTQSTLPSDPNLHRSVSSTSSTANHAAHRMIHARRRAIRRQLRLLFIYPIVYIIMWIFPFIVHCMNYSDYWAQNPVFALAFLSAFSQIMMGFIDVAIFSWRERPWRHIAGSDGTFMGSFHFWTFTRRREWIETVRRESRAPSRLGPISKQEKSFSRSSSLFGSLKGWSWGRSSSSAPSRQTTSTTANGSPSRIPPAVTTPTLPHDPAVIALRTQSQRTHSQSSHSSLQPSRPLHRRGNSHLSDRRRREVDQAHERLALERADRNPNVTFSPPLGLPTPRHREWWDRNMSLFQDGDVGGGVLVEVPTREEAELRGIEEQSVEGTPHRPP